ncbi:hypothetical protein [Streptomyces sp. CEV 2-1]|nr:hypothetical protein [Streptomyces sp. CEV 2-1]
MTRPAHLQRRQPLLAADLVRAGDLVAVRAPQSGPRSAAPAPTLPV